MEYLLNRLRKRLCAGQARKTGLDPSTSRFSLNFARQDLPPTFKSLYGLRVAPRLWSQHLEKALHELGFEPSAIDPCLFIKPGMMLVTYVDDCGVSARDPADIDRLIADLTQKGFALTREGSFSEFLGIKIAPIGNGTGVHLTQKGLISKIINVTGMQGCNPNHVPATQVALGSNPDGDPMHEIWSYSSVIGMMLYLSTNTRPDITFAVSQVARFCSAPKQSHASAVKTIVRYLAATKDQGTIMRPTGELNVDAFCDADFAGLRQTTVRSAYTHEPVTSSVWETVLWFGSPNFKPVSPLSVLWKPSILP